MRALISVSDKSGVVEFAAALVKMGWEILSTSGTMKTLREAGIPVTSVSDVTAFPEICEGRVKTLHPKIHGALLACRDKEEHMQALKENAIETIDLVCVNLYPFRQTIAKEGVQMDEAIENIDIGGPSMLRSAAKNWKFVTVVVNPSDYEQVLFELKEHGQTSDKCRLELSAKAYTHTAEYDIAIATYMREQAGLSEKLFLEFEHKQSLRYGENPHQKANFYVESSAPAFSIAQAKQLGGKELSYNNIQDANAALAIIREYSEPCCVALKHMNPCGAATAEDIHQAWEKCYEGDKVSIFGGIVAVNRELDLKLAEAMKPIFLEIIIAPAFTPEALELLSSKKNLRLLTVDMSKNVESANLYTTVIGGLLKQDMDLHTKELSADMTVSQTEATEQNIKDLDFCWKLVKHVKSNAIVVGQNSMCLGVGAGQMNRIASARIALEQAAASLKAEGKDIMKENLVLASDAFFPFDDCVSLAAEFGVKAIVQPGGSLRDADSIKKADELGIAMLFTGERHFKH